MHEQGILRSRTCSDIIHNSMSRNTLTHKLSYNVLWTMLDYILFMIFFSTHSEQNLKKHFMFAFFWNSFFSSYYFCLCKINVIKSKINVDITCIVWYFIDIAHGYGSLALWHCFNRIVFGSCSFICGYFMVYSFFFGMKYTSPNVHVILKVTLFLF